MQLATTKTFTEWMNEGFIGTYDETYPDYSSQMTTRLKLGDGTTLSIQAGEYHYCEPRVNSEDGDYNFYSKFEIGFPSKEIPELLFYAEDPDNPCETVYGYVPKEVIQLLINNRGGVVGFDKKED